MEKNQVAVTGRLIVIGGSSGSLDALLLLLPLLKKDFHTPVILVMHRNTTTGTALTELIASRTHLKVKEADEKDKLMPGWIYIAPPDYHLLVEDDGTLSLDISEKVNYCRPSIDVNFASAAVAFKEKLTAVLLSGANADGVEGMIRVKKYGGQNIVQDPQEAIVPFMPEQAILSCEVDMIAGAAGIAAILNEL